MKIMKRIAAMLLAVCLVVPCTKLAVNAADGVIFFTDLEGIKVGDEFTIKGSVKNRGGNLGDVKITMEYDSTAMKFVSGDNVTDQGDGTLVYSGTVGDKDLLEFNMEFEALVQGETRLEQTEAEVTDENGASVNIVEPAGYSDVKIVEGDGTTDSSDNETTAQQSGLKATVGGEEYVVASQFPEKELPSGFQTADINYGGQTVKGAKQEKGDMQLLYLIGKDNKGSFFAYDAEKNECSPLQLVTVSEGNTIILLSDAEGVTLPARYKKMELEISETDTIPAWHDSKNERFYLLKALNSEGETALYQYDSKDKTYQYYGSIASAVSAETDKGNGILGKVSVFVQDHADYVVIGAGFAFLILLILLIVLSVKVHRRNLELDDVYDELDELNGKKASEEPESEEEYEEEEFEEDKTPEDNSQSEDDFDDFEQFDENDLDDSYDDSEYSDEYEEEEEYDNVSEDYESDYDPDYDDDADYDDDYDFDDFEEEYENPKPAKKSKGSKDDDSDDDFSIDFIDL
nr:hypothetical protein [uncultured Sellimonas sp.]